MGHALKPSTAEVNNDIGFTGKGYTVILLGITALQVILLLAAFASPSQIEGTDQGRMSYIKNRE